MGAIERAGSAAVGAALVTWGLSRRGLSGWAMVAAGGALIGRGLAGWCPAYRVFGVDTAVPHESGVPGNRGTRVERSVEIARPPEELYAFWRDLTNLPLVMPHVRSVVVQGNRSHWSVAGPSSRDVEWEAEVINDHPNELIAWQSLPGADVRSAGSVRFEAIGDGGSTRVKVALEYLPPAGRAGAWISGLLGVSPERQLADDLERFKARMESARPAGQP